MTSFNRTETLFKQVSSFDSTPIKMRYLVEGFGRNARADRCYIDMARTRNGAIYDRIYGWCDESVEPLKDFDDGLDMSQFPDVMEQFQKGRVWSCSDVRRAHPMTRDWLVAHGIQSIILAPVCRSDGVVEGFAGFEFVRSHPHPISSQIVRNLMEAVNLIAFLLRAQHEQKRSQMFAGLMNEMNVGIWSFELDEGVPPRMYGNKAMDELLGCNGLKLTPEEYYHAWYDHIHPDHYDEIHKTVKNLMSGHHAEVQYPFLHPVRGEMWVRCGGRRDLSYTKGVRIVGRHQDVSDLIHIQRDASSDISAIARMAEHERDRAEKEHALNHAMELLVSERDFTRVLNRLFALWSQALDAQWIVLGEFVNGGFQIVSNYAAKNAAPLFESGAHLPYLPDISGELDDMSDHISFVDFQGSPVARQLAAVSSDAPLIRSIASCHSFIVRFNGRRWGSLVALSKERHELSSAELRFGKLSARGVEIALMRKESAR